MFNKIYTTVLVIVFLLALASCSEESNPVFDQNNFSKVYDNNSFTAAYYPIDVQQTEDGGYLVLAGTVLENSYYFGTYILKTDKNGDFVNEQYLADEYVHPVGKLIKVDDTYTFFCMDELTQEARMVTVDGAAENITITPVGGITYPAVVAQDNTNFLLLSYNNTDQQSIISIINATAGVLASKGFSIGAGADKIDEDILNHYIRTGRKLPFQVGKTGSTYFFNGFYNYTFSLVFTDLNADDPQGEVNGNQDDSGLSAVVPISGSKFACARFSFGNNYTLPNVNLDLTGISQSGNLGGNSFPELEDNAKVQILRGATTSTNYLVYASNTRSKQIGLYFYSESDGSFLSSRYLGFSNPYEIANLNPTADGGLIVCGTTYLAGRFPRICLFKISKENLEEQL